MTEERDGQAHQPELFLSLYSQRQDSEGQRRKGSYRCYLNY
jgi:hypothetical protein